jgi:hypothetical protein
MVDSRPWSVDGDRPQLIASLTGSTPFANTPYVSYIGRYINAYSANAKPIQWKYSDLTRRIRSNVVSATCR